MHKSLRSLFRHLSNGRRRRASLPLIGGLLFVVLLLVLLLFRTPCFILSPDDTPLAAPPDGADAGLFSWSSTTVNESDGDLFPLMKQEKMNVLYQNFSSKTSNPEQMTAFLETALEEGITVYHLTGHSAWALDPEGKKICEAVETAALYNQQTEQTFLEWRKADGKSWDTIPRLNGIMLDIEPYTLDEWDEDADAVMDSFVSGMKKAYTLAQAHDLQLILCIPWYYEKKGQQEGLEELIANGCDSIAVMNYYRGAEIKNIALETTLVQKYGKGIITIYELQKANGRGIKEINSYHDLGLYAARENFAAVQAAYPEQTISVAFHHYRVLEEVLDP